MRNVSDKPVIANDKIACERFITDMKTESDPEEKDTEKLHQSVVFPSAPLDRYGFYLTDKRCVQENLTPAKQREAIWLENHRTQKWVNMIGKEFEHWNVCQVRKPSCLKRRIRKGIPEALRGRVWCHLSNSTQMARNNPGTYQRLLQTPASSIPCLEAINRDIGRTFPSHSLFKDTQSMGQTSLTNVLRAYSIYDPDVGYCQGMGFISALFLSYMPEDQSFWTLVAVLNHKRYDLANLYRPTMAKVGEVIYIYEGLLAKFMPKLSKHLENEGLHPTMYLTQWFLTLFTYNFPFEFVTRVWDVFLHEGWKCIFRIALALMKASQKDLLSKDFEPIMEYFRELPIKVKTVEILKIAYDLPLKRSQIEALREKYQLVRTGVK